MDVSTLVLRGRRSQYQAGRKHFTVEAPNKIL